MNEAIERRIMARRRIPVRAVCATAPISAEAKALLVLAGYRVEWTLLGTLPYYTLQYLDQRLDRWSDENRCWVQAGLIEQELVRQDQGVFIFTDTWGRAYGKL